MNSNRTSLCTDRSLSEDIKLDFEQLTYSLADQNLKLSRASALSDSITSFPSASFSIKSSDCSDEVNFIKEKNMKIKAAIIYKVSKLRSQAKSLAGDSDDSLIEFSLIRKEQQDAAYDLFKDTDCPTRETEGNLGILQDIVCNVKKLNKSLEDAKKTLDVDHEYIEQLSKEHETLTKQLEEITHNIYGTLDIETSESLEHISGCKCLSF